MPAPPRRPYTSSSIGRRSVGTVSILNIRSFAFDFLFKGYDDSYTTTSAARGNELMIAKDQKAVFLRNGKPTVAFMLIQKNRKPVLFINGNGTPRINRLFNDPPQPPKRRKRPQLKLVVNKP